MNDQTHLAKIEERLDKDTAGALPIATRGGGLQFTSMTDVMEFSKLMSLAQEAVPPHCRGKPGVCLAITVQALEWKMSPFSVANKSYVANGRVSYEAQLIHAVIEMRAPILGRIRHSYSGSGENRQCKVWAFIKGENDAVSYESPPTKDILPKNSPLWKTKPDLQLFYNTVRDFCRMHFPDVILGVYSVDEMEDAPPMGPDNARDVSPGDQLMERLQAGKPPTEGFALNTVDQDDEVVVDVAEESPSPAEARQELTEQAQALDMGYGDPKPDEASDQKPAEAAADPEPAAVEATVKEAVAEKVAEAPPPPATDAAYKDYALGWLRDTASVTQIDERWKREKRLRAECKITPETLEVLDDAKSERISAIRRS